MRREAGHDWEEAGVPADTGHSPPVQAAEILQLHIRLPEVRGKDRLWKSYNNRNPALSAEAQPGDCFFGCRCDDPEVRGWAAFSQTGKDLGAGRAGIIPRNHVQLGVIQTAQGWLKPLYRLLKKQLLGCSVIHADETVVQVLKEDGKPAASESRMWVYASNDRSGKPIRYFEYQPSRSGKHAAAFLKGFNGCLVTDGYAGYNQVEGVVRCGCWAHMRRKWREAMPKGATKENSKAAIGYDYCNKLFAAEKKYAGLSDAERKTARQVRVESLLEAYWCWVETLDPVPGSKLAEAVAYARNQKPYLSAFLDHGEVDISNNFAENAIRPFTLGRKNWLFCNTPKGADSSAIVYTLVETAKANGLEPYAYLLQALTELPYLGKSPSQEDLNDFLSWSAKMQTACAARNTTTAGDLC